MNQSVNISMETYVRCVDMLSSILQTKHRGKNTPRQGFPRDHCKSDGGQGIILFIERIFDLTSFTNLKNIVHMICMRIDE